MALSRYFNTLILFAIFASSACAQDQTTLPDRSWLPTAPALPPPTGQVIRVSSVDALFRAANEVRPGGTILLADGHYMMPRYFELRTDNVTLRSESGSRQRVVIDGAQSRHGELIGIRACEGVTIADLTIQNVRWNGFKLNSNTGVHRVTIHNCVIHNIWQRGIKGVGVPADNREQLRPKDCHVRFCLFYNDRPKQFPDDPADTPEKFGGNYIGGMDIMYATGWTISDNVFIGIQGRTGEARGAIFLWHDSRDCIIERNTIIDCDSGICLGNAHIKAETMTHCLRCVVRNNFITRAPESGILADYTTDCVVVHNTIHDPSSRLERLIRLVHDNDGLIVANNLLSGPGLQNQASGDMQIDGNVTKVLTDSFESAVDGNLHLKHRVAGVTDACKRLPNATHDFDGEMRDHQTDAGADQLVTR
ncbi:hypothetical protein K227x_07540 [Rubripirellula lacrimiformis]|uniref:Right handed beta helix domain-containing protein n=1 Tax=Rubripirellula lacrimiformis TaxID=1930273 RepID=A0A517N5R8_9BACT|nr:right-handed parallel beta-helix repeat-containing protein [Rubripirellula lacrimiformis]QDT02378.1 hypothetical protein K227x_07540 [Rubripirellula lacrimiformis]